MNVDGQAHGSALVRCWITFLSVLKSHAVIDHPKVQLESAIFYVQKRLKNNLKTPIHAPGLKHSVSASDGGIAQVIKGITEEDSGITETRRMGRNIFIQVQEN